MCVCVVFVRWQSCQLGFCVVLCWVVVYIKVHFHSARRAEESLTHACVFVCVCARVDFVVVCAKATRQSGSKMKTAAAVAVAVAVAAKTKTELELRPDWLGSTRLAAAV